MNGRSFVGGVGYQDRETEEEEEALSLYNSASSFILPYRLSLSFLSPIELYHMLCDMYPLLLQNPIIFI